MMRGLALRVTAMLVLVIVGIVWWAGPAGAAQNDDSSGGNDDRVVLTGGATVDADERAGTVVVFDGAVLIEGRSDDIIAFNGDVRVRGTVTGEVVAMNGRVLVESGARVTGDVRSSQRPVVAADATVLGTVEKTDFGNFFDAVGIALMIGWWVAVSISTLVLGLVLVAVFPKAAAAAVDVSRRHVGPAIGWGLFMLVAVPIIAFVALATLIGIPLGLIGLAAAATLGAVGYLTSMLVLGRLLGIGADRVFVAFIAGWAILRIVEIVPFVGGLVTAAASIFGVGAVTVAAWQAGRRPTTPESEEAVSAPASPTEPFASA